MIFSLFIWALYLYLLYLSFSNTTHQPQNIKNKYTDYKYSVTQEQISNRGWAISISEGF